MMKQYCRLVATRLSFFGLLLIVLTNSALAEISSEAVIDLSAIKDQHDNPFSLDRPQQYILFAADMDTKDILQKALKAIDTTCLNNGEVIYLANISGMPKMVAKLFALPKMRKYPYSIWLDRDGSISEKLPTKNKAIALIQTDNQRVTSSEFFETSLTLANRLKTACGDTE